jgi:3-hydroxyacyl-CoA dehydrogenase, NAD binding domain
MRCLLGFATTGHRATPVTTKYFAPHMLQSACHQLVALQIGMHFMNPPLLVDMLEIVGGKRTSSEVRRLVLQCDTLLHCASWHAQGLVHEEYSPAMDLINVCAGVSDCASIGLTSQEDCLFFR